MINAEASGRQVQQGLAGLPSLPLSQNAILLALRALQKIIGSTWDKLSDVLTTSAKAEMTFPRVVRDLLIFAPS